MNNIKSHPSNNTMTALSFHIIGGIIAFMDLLLKLIVHDIVSPHVITKTQYSNRRISEMKEKLEIICMKQHYIPFEEYREVREQFRKRFELPKRPSTDETLFWKLFPISV